ncbi:MAG TPA: PQQ-binding-like beta-propeller repeat protein [Trebonia sp.]|nr:PQQ-binding-like beta-propeller repeat protein [Trebonia sp.]
MAVALLIVVLFPLPVLGSDTPPRQPACQGSGCRAKPVSAQLWAVGLAGIWSAGTGPGSTGDGGTVPAIGQAYVAVGGGVAVLGTGLSVTGYNLSSGKELWQTTLDAPLGAVIMSVRAWPGVITVGLLSPDGRSRTEVVLNATTGGQVRRYPAAVLGGAVAASKSATVIVGPASVTSYNNATGRIRWQHKTAAGQAWQADGQSLYLAESPGGHPGSSQVTALQVIDLATGTQRSLSSPLGRPFSGTLALAADGAVLFASPAGVTAYSGSTGGVLWAKPDAVPEGTDPAAGLVDLTLPGGALAGVDPLLGTVLASVPASAATGAAGLYVVRDGVALGLDSGANGTAWGYDMAKGTVAWTWPALPWPHFFSDLSGLGGSAAVSGDMVVVTACPHLASSPGMCADPELVAFNV